jgi:integrase
MQGTRPRRPRGSGSIVEHQGAWWVVTSGRQNGIRVRNWGGPYSTKRDAQLAVDAELERIRKTRATVRTVVEGYVGHVAVKRRSPTTVQRYRGLAKNLATIDALKVESISGGQIESLHSLLRTEGLSETTVHHVDALLRAAFRWARRVKGIAVNPYDAHQIEVPRRSRSEARALSVDDARRFLAHVDCTRYANALRLALATGLRRGEIVGLKTNCVDLQRAIAIIRESRYEVVGAQGQKQPKSGNIREVDLSKMALEALRKERSRQTKLRRNAGDVWEDTGFVFTDEFGHPLSPYSLSNAFRHVAEKAKIGKVYTLHSLRHTAATWMLAGGMDIKTVQHVLGHTEAKTTMDTYGHVVDGRTKTAVALIESRLRKTRKLST